MKMSYREVKGKIVICKDSVYFSLTKEQVQELKCLIYDIEAGTKLFYKEDARRN